MKVSLNDYKFLKKTLKENTKTKILSSSMEPYIYKDEIVEVSPTSIEDLRIGDVIVFWRDDKLICHILVGIDLTKEDSFFTKGLSNNRLDPALNKDYILGKVSKPRLGAFRRLLFILIIKFKSRFKK